MKHIQTSVPRGWTLIELLVAMTLSLLVIAGISQIYLAAKRSYDIQTNLAQIQDVGRYVIDVLTKDIHNAGYWGLMNINLANSTPLDDPPLLGGDKLFLTGDIAPGGCPGASATNWGRMITQKLFGFDTDPASNAYTCINDWLQGDVLTVRYADPASPPPFTNTRLYIRTAPLQGSIVFGNPAGDAQNFVNDTIVSDHALVAHAYYVADPISTECGDVPVFARKILDRNGRPWKEPLVNGVEQLQFQYGVDTAITPANPLGDGSVNQYLNANDVTAGNLWDQVRAVRFWVLVRANCPESGYTDTSTYQLGDIPYAPGDHYRRALYSSTVALRN